ncbi:MAG: TolC family protein [Desulfobacterales bacterium]|nr:TolC family protein [Desulfobacterales bacterium]
MRCTAKILVLVVTLIMMVGCATFHPKPIAPDQTASAFESRTLSNIGLKEFVEKNLQHKITIWPPGSWDFEILTLVAFYYHPDLDVARAQWRVAKAGIISAGGRPNPRIGFTPQYNADTAGGLSPWTLGFNLDISIETADKRGYRIAKAKHLSEAARLNIATVVWQVRSRMRKSLLNLYRAELAETLLQNQQKVQEEIVRLLEQRLAFGEASQPDVTQVHIPLIQTRLSLREAQKENAEARVQVADALGLPVNALNDVHISFDFTEQLPSAVDIPLQVARRQALLNRPDILGALSEYAASEAALQLEIARQYPDIHIGPGYSWDQGNNKWSLGFSISLPIFNRNQGPIAEAEARRKEAESRFVALQSRVIGEIDRAFTGYHAALQKLETADFLQSTMKKQLQSIQAMFNAGEEDRLSLLSNQSEFHSIKLLRLDALANSQQSLSLLEDAVQRPLQPLKSFPVVPEKNPRTKEADKNETP